MKKFKCKTARVFSTLLALLISFVLPLNTAIVYANSTSNTVLGDYNGDKTLDILDLVRYKRVIAGIATTEISMDFNCDGEETAADLAILKTVLLYGAENLPEYTVTFKDKDGNILKTQKVMKWFSASAPDVPEINGFVFKNWDKEYKCVVGDVTVTAEYEAVPIGEGLNFYATGGTNRIDDGKYGITDANQIWNTDDWFSAQISGADGIKDFELSATFKGTPNNGAWLGMSLQNSQNKTQYIMIIKDGENYIPTLKSSYVFTGEGRRNNLSSDEITVKLKRVGRNYTFTYGTEEWSFSAFDKLDGTRTLESEFATTKVSDLRFLACMTGRITVTSWNFKNLDASIEAIDNGLNFYAADGTNSMDPGKYEITEENQIYVTDDWFTAQVAQADGVNDFELTATFEGVPNNGAMLGISFENIKGKKQSFMIIKDGENYIPALKSSYVFTGEGRHNNSSDDEITVTLKRVMTHYTVACGTEVCEFDSSDLPDGVNKFESVFSTTEVSDLRFFAYITGGITVKSWKFNDLDTPDVPDDEVYHFNYKRPMHSQTDSFITMDGKLDEDVWKGQNYIEWKSDDNKKRKATAVFTEKGLYIGAFAEDDTIIYNGRHAVGNNDEFWIRIVKEDEVNYQNGDIHHPHRQFVIQVDAKGSLSMSEHRYDAAQYIDGEIGNGKAKSFSIETFMAWNEMGYTEEELTKDGYPDAVKIYIEYRTVGTPWSFPGFVENFRYSMYYTYNCKGLAQPDVSSYAGNAVDGECATVDWNVDDKNKTVTGTVNGGRTIFLKQDDSGNKISKATSFMLSAKVELQRGASGYGWTGLLSYGGKSNILIYTMYGDMLLNGDSLIVGSARAAGGNQWIGDRSVEKKVSTSYTGNSAVLKMYKSGPYFYYYVNDIYVGMEYVEQQNGEVQVGFYSGLISKFSNWHFVNYDGKEDVLQKLLPQ